ncbi:MAG TPA: CBS domain-containing protein [Ruminococcaceae bacterium]|nr:CBS domain-containing protein [Oscillospiraceae bacterium]
MQVSEIMTTRLISVKPTSSVREAANLMNQNNIGVIPVVDKGSVKGMLTDRDIVLRCVAENKNVNSVKVSDVCSNGMVSVRPQDPVSNAMHLMSAEQVRRLPVIDQGKLVGMLSFADIAREKAGMEVAQSISDISKP